MDSKIDLRDNVGVTVVRAGGLGEEGIAPRATYAFECIAPDGSVRWRDTFPNTVTTEGKNSLLDVYFDAATQITAWYLGLISSVDYSAIAAADTMSSHAGWKEANATNAPNYSLPTSPINTTNRATLTFGEPSSGSLATSAAASFSITGNGTVKGGFITSGQAKAGTTGTLYSAGLFTGGDRAVINGDTINVTVTLSAA